MMLRRLFLLATAVAFGWTLSRAGEAPPERAADPSPNVPYMLADCASSGVKLKVHFKTEEVDAVHVNGVLDDDGILHLRLTDELSQRRGGQSGSVCFTLRGDAQAPADLYLKATPRLGNLVPLLLRRAQRPIDIPDPSNRPACSSPDQKCVVFVELVPGG